MLRQHKRKLYLKLNREQEDKRSDATDDDSSNAAGEIVIGTKSDQCPDPHTGEVKINEIK
jgi:hypothetical protein